MSIEFIKPNADGSDLKIGIVSARFNDWACDAMFASCYEELKAHGVKDENIVVTTVPGALEIPGALVMLYEGYPDLDALVAIGCVIRGETYHFELVANESSRGVTDFVTTEGISVANCILTVENEEQAKVRVQERVPTLLASLWKWAIFAASADAALWKITEKIMDSNHTGAKSPAKKRGGRSARRRSREFALQGVYQWLMSHTDPEAIDAAALEAEDFDKADQAFYRELLHGVTEEFPSLEASYAPHIDREVTSLSPIERAILLIGTYELKNTTTPYRVVINEAVELAKSFGGSDGFKYVNGVLDKMVPELRPYEVVKGKNA